jgi:hypothetical protein
VTLIYYTVQLSLNWLQIVLDLCINFATNFFIPNSLRMKYLDTYFYEIFKFSDIRLKREISVNYRDFSIFQNHIIIFFLLTHKAVSCFLLIFNFLLLLLNAALQFFVVKQEEYWTAVANISSKISLALQKQLLVLNFVRIQIFIRHGFANNSKTTESFNVKFYTWTYQCL